MGVENKTANQLTERRNNFLRELSAVGRDVIVRLNTTIGGSFDPVTETMTNGSIVDQDTTFTKAVMMMPIRQLNDVGSGQQGMSVVAGHKIEGVEVDANLFLRAHPRVPLNPSAIYLVDGISYRIVKILANVRIGLLPCWNEVLLVKA